MDDGLRCVDRQGNAAPRRPAEDSPHNAGRRRHRPHRGADRSRPVSRRRIRARSFSAVPDGPPAKAGRGAPVGSRRKEGARQRSLRAAARPAADRRAGVERSARPERPSPDGDPRLHAGRERSNRPGRVPAPAARDVRAARIPAEALDADRLAGRQRRHDPDAQLHGYAVGHGVAREVAWSRPRLEVVPGVAAKPAISVRPRPVSCATHGRSPAGAADRQRRGGRRGGCLSTPGLAAGRPGRHRRRKQQLGSLGNEELERRCAPGGRSPPSPDLAGDLVPADLGFSRLSRSGRQHSRHAGGAHRPQPAHRVEPY